MKHGTGTTTRRITRTLVAGALVAASLIACGVSAAHAAGPLSGLDLATYVRVGRYDLPEPTRTAAPVGSKLAQEASAVTYDWDTDTLFVVGDGGTSIVQVSKTGALIDSMTLAAGGSPQGTEFYDTEGLAYVGGGKFVLVEERDRQVVRFTYAAGTTLTRAATQTVKLGTTVGNIGLEGVTNDPSTGGFVAAKETAPLGVFQTAIDFTAGTATNGSPSTVNSTNLFDPALAGVLDFADVFALSNVAALAASSDTGNLLLLSQESGQIVELDRGGNVLSALTIASDVGNPLSVPDQQHEGLTMDEDGRLYVVAENGGGDIDHPQLWVYAKSAATNQAPTALGVSPANPSVVENTSTAIHLKVADLSVTDDGIGTNVYGLSGPEASSFEVVGTALYLKAGVVLDFETKTSYSVTVSVDDASVGSAPDATAALTLTVTDVVNETPAAPSIIVSEVSPWGSGSTPYTADWFELTNTGATTVDLTGWKVDDDSNSFGSAIALAGVSSLAPGRSVVFIEGDATKVSLFKSAWFGATVPAGFLIGTYSGSGIGLGTGGDAVNVFDSVGNRVTGVRFGTSTIGFTFDNAIGTGGSTLPLPLISTLSVAGTNGAFVASDSHGTGSPGRIGNTPPAQVPEAPLALLLPVSALAAIGGATLLRRRRRGI